MLCCNSLFGTDPAKVDEHYQYAKDASSISSKVTFENSNSSVLQSIPLAAKTLPLVEKNRCPQQLNKSAPAVLEVLKENEELPEDEDSESDCDSEIENLFRGEVESPKHTSTPKTPGHGQEMRHCRKRMPLRLQMKYQQQQER